MYSGSSGGAQSMARAGGKNIPTRFPRRLERAGPSERLDTARLKRLTRPARNDGWFELFDTPNWAVRISARSLTISRALEGELERTLQTLSDVKRCG